MIHSTELLYQVPPDLLQRSAIVALVLVVTWVVSKLLGGFVLKTFGRINPNVARQAKRVIIWITWLTGIILALDQIGLELTWLLVAIAIGAIIIVVALRDFLSNLAARETIYLYNQFKIGDWIEVGKIFGRVVDITWNDTVLSTLDNETIYVPNSTVAKNIIINKTNQSGIRISVPLTISNSLSFQEVEQALLEIGKELQEELMHETKPEVRLISIGREATRLELLLRIINPAKSGLVSSEVLKRIKKKLEENPKQ